MSPLYKGGLGGLGGGGGGAELIGEHLLLADAAALTLSGLDLTDWAQCRLIIQARSVLGTDGAGDYTRNFIRFNSDTGANYLWATENDDANSVNQGAGGYVNGIIAAHGTGPDEEAGIYGICFVDLMYPGATDHYKNVYSYGVISYLTTSLSTHGGGIWKNNAAITRIDCVANDGGNFIAGSRMALIGIG